MYRKVRTGNIKSYTLCVLNKKSYTSLELKKKCIAKGFSNHEIEETISELTAQGFINDEVFAYHYGLSKTSRTLWGFFRIQEELKKRGIEEKIIESTLAKLRGDVDEATVMNIAADKWLKGKMVKELSRKEQKKLADYLHRRGFRRDSVCEFVRGEDS
ncbi:MAG: regulatory protein RecX [Thermodesulfobacteriota bacterium]|nr:regulatory protein RecX [Thermodesulfobacteriota bacterium]